MSRAILCLGQCSILSYARNTELIHIVIIDNSDDWQKMTAQTLS